MGVVGGGWGGSGGTGVRYTTKFTVFKIIILL